MSDVITVNGAPREDLPSGLSVAALVAAHGLPAEGRGVAVAVDGGLVADVVGLAVADAALDAPARHPDEEAVGVVVAALPALADGEFVHDNEPFRKPFATDVPLRQVIDQAGEVEGFARPCDDRSSARLTCASTKSGLIARAR